MQQVFNDPSGRRARRTNVALAAVAALTAVLVAGWAVLAAAPAALPGLPAPGGRAHGFVEHPLQPRRSASDGRPVAVGALAARHPTSTVSGFFVPWDDNSLQSLRRNLDSLDQVVAEWWHTAPDGSLLDESPQQDAAMLALVHERRPELPVVPLVNNYDPDSEQWRGDTVARLVADPASRDRLVSTLAGHVRDGGFAGLNVDYESLPAGSGPAYGAFLTKLAAALHAMGATLIVDAPADDPTFPYAAVGRAADQVALMAYDEHEDTSDAGPVAGQGWLQRVLTQRLKEVPADRLTLTVGGYGYDWNTTAHTASELSFQDAMTSARTAGAAPRLDPATLNPTFAYADAQGQQHEVWYLDAATAFNAAQAARGAGVTHLAVWRLGTEDAGTWDALRSTGADLPERLAAVATTYDVTYDGTGELLSVTGSPVTGHRTVAWDAAQGLVTAESFDTLPQSYTIRRQGGDPGKRIALTFDDGPDATWTPRILDALAAEQVPGTFFVVGLAGQAQPDLLRRMVEGGNEIGVHTFTHPDLGRVTPEQFDLELNLTQHLIEGATGHRTVLFRPPFAEDVEPATPDQMGVVGRASAAGYVTVGMHLDPKDFEQPGVQQIVDRVVAQAEAGDGHIVLLHDGGGDRAQTVAALPLLIEALKAKGYTFVTASELAGQPREVANPAVTSPLRSGVAAIGLGFDALGVGGQVVAVLFAAGIVASVGRVVILVLAALARRRAERHAPAPDATTPTVTAVVPAYNEAAVVNATVATLLASDLADLRVLVVDDGSTDGTAATVAAAYGDHPRVRLLSIPNGGKANALNVAMTHVDTEVMVVIDADTQVSPDAARLLAAHFADPRVAAVAGNAKVGNRTNLLTRWQALEYITSQNVERRALAAVNAIGVVPGAIGAWRVSVLRELGGYHPDTLAEDADLTLRALRAGHRITYEMGAKAWTEAPATVGAFLKQRDRWAFGTLQAVWKQRGVLLSRSAAHRQLRWVTLPNAAVFQVLVPIVGVVLDLVWLGALAFALAQAPAHPDLTLAPTAPILVLGVALQVLDLLVALVAFALEPGEDWHLAPLIVLQRVVYRQLLALVAIRAVVAALKGRRRQWNKLVRLGTVRVATGG